MLRSYIGCSPEYPCPPQHRLRRPPQLRFVLLGKRPLGETDGEAGTALNGPELDDPRRCAVDHVDQGLQRFPVAVCRIPVIRRGYGDHKPLRSEEHTSELQSRSDLVCRLLLEKKK